jgi:EmrB/QacA subfamily drug resistance transporter
MAHRHTAANLWPSDERGFLMRGTWWPLTAVCLGAFMLLVQAGLVPVALAGIAADLGGSFASMQWVLDGYALALAALLLGAGVLGDLVGRRKVYVAGLVVFAVASVACGLAPNITVLVAATLVQGAGAAAMFATAMALLSATYQGRQRGVAFAVWGAVSGAAAGLGVLLGGLLTEYVSWRAIFLVNPPLAAVAIALTVVSVRESRNPHARGLDWPGLLTFTAAAGALTYGVIRAGESGWDEPVTLAWLGAGLLTLAAFVAVERRSTHPLLDLSLFRGPRFTALMVAALVLGVAAFGYLAYTSLWLQSVLGMGATGAGLALLPLSGAAFVASLVTGKRLHGVSPRVTVGGGLLLIAAGAFAQSVVDAGSSWSTILFGLVLTGAGVGLLGPALTSAAMAAVPHERAGMASGALNTFRQLGQALGIAVLGAVFHRAITSSLTGKVADVGTTVEAVTAGHAPAGPLAGAFTDGLSAAYLVAGATGIVAAVVVLALAGSPARETTPAVR